MLFFCLQLLFQITLKAFREEISKKLELENNSYSLVFNGKVLKEESKTLSDLGIFKKMKREENELEFFFFIDKSYILLSFSSFFFSFFFFFFFSPSSSSLICSLHHRHPTCRARRPVDRLPPRCARRGGSDGPRTYHIGKASLTISCALCLILSSALRVRWWSLWRHLYILRFLCFMSFFF